MKVQIAVLCAVGMVVGCGLAPEEEVPNLSREEFMKLVVQDPESGVFLANGDEPYGDLDELNELYESVAYGIARQGEGLAVMNVGGRDVKWSAKAARNLTYCVSTRFGSLHDTVVRAMASATAAWEAAANVDFIHVPAEDARCTKSNAAVVFDVSPVQTSLYFARSFSPNFGRSTRNVLIDDSAFGSRPTLTAVLRHELGHTLGFRHEHTRPEAGACFEDDRWRALTPYDPASVMHYPQCHGTGSWALTLTAQDKRGAAKLYPF